MAFSLIVITNNNSYLELLNTKAELLPNETSRPLLPLYATSQKFNFETNMPYAHHFIEWITFGENLIVPHNNYFSYIFMNISYHNNTLIVYHTLESNPNRVIGISINILLVGKQTNSGNTAQYFFYSYDGQHYGATRKFKVNLGVPSQAFGNPLTSGYCIHGATEIDLYVDYANLSSLNSSFIF